MKKKITIKGINEEEYLPDISHSEQISLLNQSYLEEKKDKTNIIYREINKKINGYKNQDIKKQIYNEKKLNDVYSMLPRFLEFRNIFM